MERSSFFNSIANDREYQASDFAEFFNSLVTNGVFPSPTTNLQVLSNSNMTVTLKAGPAWIKGYHYTNDSDLILPITTADGVLNRIDRIVIKLDTVARNITAVVKKGVFASSPVAPVLQRDADAYELGVADVYIGAGVVSITQAKITDQRLNTALCGWVNSLIQADTTAIFNQYQDWFTAQSGTYNTQMTASETTFEADFNTWFNAMKGQLTTDAAGNLQTQINTHISDDIKHVGYALATNVGNAYSVNIPDLIALTDGLQIRAKFNVASTGAITVNPNALGAKAVVDYFGNAVTNVRLNLIANLAYDATSGNFILQGKGGGGNAVAGDVYTGKTATTDNGPVIGTNKYKIGAAIKDTDMLLLAGGKGAQVWLNTSIVDPKRCCVSASGDVYVAYNTGVRKFNSAGVQQWFVSDVTGATDVSVDDSDNVYVTYGNAIGTKNVRKLNSAGVEIWSLTDIGYAMGIAVDSSGNIYVAYDTMGVSVRKLTTLGAQIWSNSDTTSGQTIAVDSVGNVYAGYLQSAGSVSLRKMNSSGVSQWTKTDGGSCQGVAVDSAFNVYATYVGKSVGQVVKYNSAGVVQWFNNDLNNGRGVAVDVSGNVYVAYYQVSGSCVRKYNSFGAVLWDKSDILSAIDIACDNTAGGVYVAYDGSNGVRKLDGATYYTINT